MGERQEGLGNTQDEPVVARDEQRRCSRGNDGNAASPRPSTEPKRGSPMKKMLNKVRGASMVEYALLLVAILLLAAGAFKALGPKVGTAATRSGSQL